MSRHEAIEARSARVALSRRARACAIALMLCCTMAGCSVRNMAMNQVSDALAASGSGFGTDDDVELIGAAAPFSLKLMEGVLAENPAHRGLLLAATRGFVQYAYAFVELKADEIEDADVRAAYARRERARRAPGSGCPARSEPWSRRTCASRGATRGSRR